MGGWNLGVVTFAADYSCRVVIFVFAELSDLVEVLRTSQELIGCNVSLQSICVDQWLLDGGESWGLGFGERMLDC